MMRKIWKYLRYVIQCVRSSCCINNLFIKYLFLKRNSIFKRNYAVTFDVSCGMCIITSSVSFTGCLNKRGPIFKIGIIPSFIKDSFLNFIR